MVWTIAHAEAHAKVQQIRSSKGGDKAHLYYGNPMKRRSSEDTQRLDSTDTRRFSSGDTRPL